MLCVSKLSFSIFKKGKGTKGREKERERERERERRGGRETDTQTDRQTDRHTHTLLHCRRSPVRDFGNRTC